ncbi:MAG: glycosyltransferase family 1 protein, partial [Tepidisphaeraceae bacterium]
MSSKLRIIVGGMVGQFPLGGVAWDYFHYVLALHELGHDVYYHEDTNTWPYNPSIRQPSSDGNYNVAFIRAFFERYAPALVDRWHYRLLQDQCFGMSKEAFDAVA